MKGIQRFIYASTCSVYGVSEKSAKDGLNEDSPLNPVSLYAKTKISSEQGILEMVNENFAPIIMRMSTLYGYSPRMRFDLVVNTMTMTSFIEKKVNVFGGEQWRPLIHVKDAAEAFIKVLNSDVERMSGKVYNVGSEKQNYKIKDVAKMIVGTIHNLSPDGVSLNIEKTNTDARDYRVSFKRIQDELGFSVKHTVEEAAEEIYNKLTTGEIKDPKQKVYYNHYFDASEELIG
jgi:nucleoside-diphosphate-sugar epimerase